MRRYKMEVNRILHGNCLELLKQLPPESIDCIITSPPYWGLRSYGESAVIHGGIMQGASVSNATRGKGSWA